jgi:hypothetical protein
MNMIINFSTNEMLDNNSLFALKGGNNSGTTNNNGISGIIAGGDETDKRPKKPTVGDTSIGKNVYKS